VPRALLRPIAVHRREVLLAHATSGTALALLHHCMWAVDRTLAVHPADLDILGVAGALSLQLYVVGPLAAWTVLARSERWVDPPPMDLVLIVAMRAVCSERLTIFFFVVLYIIFMTQCCV
jgi:hypothetical protein